MISNFALKSTFRKSGIFTRARIGYFEGHFKAIDWAKCTTAIIFIVLKNALKFETILGIKTMSKGTEGHGFGALGLI